MTKFVKLTKWDNQTDWDKGTPTNKEILTDVYINPELIQMVQMTECFIPGKADKGDTHVPKVMITFGVEMDLVVHNSLEDVLQVCGM